MFLGHFALGLAARPLAPRVPLPVLLLAPQVMDVAWPILVGLGIERARIEPGHPRGVAAGARAHAVLA